MGEEQIRKEDECKAETVTKKLDQFHHRKLTKQRGFFMFNENTLFDNTFGSVLSRRPRQLLSLLTNKTKQTVHLKTAKAVCFDAAVKKIARLMPVFPEKLYYDVHRQNKQTNRNERINESLK